MNAPFAARLSEITSTNSGTDSDAVLGAFLDAIQSRGLELYPAQEEALLELFAGRNVILNTPTGSGKSLVALGLHFSALAAGRKSIYTSPIKALVNEKFLSLCHEFGANQVGLITGDASVNRDAPVICCTAEILANMALAEGEYLAFSDIVADEFHYYSDKQRGVAWQIPLLTLKKARFLLMSATLADMDPFLNSMTRLNGRESVLVQSQDRPVPLDFEYRETPLHETIQDLLGAEQSPIYVVNFTQRDATETAWSLLSTDFCSKEQKRKILDELDGVKFQSPFGKEFSRLIKHGIGLHHAGLLPRYRILVERLAQKGLLKVICGTDTLGVGVNIPIRTVLFTKLCKYDGEKTAILSVRDFLQISGRAGRRGFDVRGRVVAQAPEHVIENLRMEQKAAGDPKKIRKIVKKQPPPHGFVPWSRDTFERLRGGKPEPLVSRFQISHGMLLHVLSRRDGSGCSTMRQLITDSHEKPAQKIQHRRHGFRLFRSLLDRRLIEFSHEIPGSRPNRPGIRVNVDLQAEFSLNQSLSLYLIDTLAHLDPYAPDYSLDILTLVESILENPDLVLRKQLDRVKGERLRELKEAGVEYEERMAELENLEYPKPRRDFIYETFNSFSERHPWIGQENIRPKSIAREMYELYMSFEEYIREYELQRAEGLLLRYLSDVYKALLQTVPEQFKNEDVDAITAYFGAMVRRVDSSLLDEWEKMRDPLAFEERQARGLKSPPPPDADAFQGGRLDTKTLTIQTRNEIFRLVRALASGDFETACDIVAPGGPDENDVPWTVERFESLAKVYAEDHSAVLTTSQARGTEFTRWKRDERMWRIEQALVDPEGHNDWALTLELSLELAREHGHPVLRLVALGPAAG
ncbi:MAG: DUF3516 domain-containing protein [Bdellovibrionaceae bacterium]|nr:DUF3516 domain-containing protein [Pseudobdellovibrionaceae bacterium]